MSVIIIQGASRGIGYAMVKMLYQAGSPYQIIGTCRDPEAASHKLKNDIKSGTKNFDDKLKFLELDLTKERTISDAASHIESKFGQRSIKLLFNCAGILDDPEKAFKQLDLENMEKVFRVNCFGPGLVYKHFINQMQLEPKAETGKELLPNFAIMASMSARVGSISDNRVGGWMTYRSSKAALNMLTKGLSIELSNRKGKCIAINLHPGTVKTDLSKNYLAHTPSEKIFSPEQAANYLWNVLKTRSMEDSGKIFAWDGKVIPY